MIEINWDKTEFLFALVNSDKALVEFFEHKPSTTSCEDCWMVNTSETLYLKKAWLLIDKPKPINAVTALYAFAGWLTSMDKPITFSSNHWATPAADMVAEMIKLNDIGGECDFDNIKTPSDFAFPIDFDADIPKEFDEPWSSKPIYTAAMCEANELPPIGSKVEFIGNDDYLVEFDISDGDELTCLVHTKDFEGEGIGVYRHKSGFSVSILNQLIKPIDTRTDEQKAQEQILHAWNNRNGSFSVLDAIKAGKIHNVTWSK